MSEELDFMQMLSAMRVIDDDDRVRVFKDCIESQYSIVSRKVAEYKRDGSLTITMKFQPDKKNKNVVNVYAEVKRSIPKGSQCNSFYSDPRTGELYFEDPNQMKLWKGADVHPINDQSNQDDIV